MQVILLQDVAKIGRRLDVVTVADGYGLNKLIPQGMAKPATTENLKAVKAQATQTESVLNASAEAFAELTKTLDGKVVDVKVEANEDGKLYQALKAEDIVAGIKAAENVIVEVNQVVVKSPIKQLGEHSIELHSGDQSAIMTINVIAG